MKRQYLVIFLLGGVLALSGCASPLTGETYSREEARRPQIIRTGVVESVRPVRLNFSGRSTTSRFSSLTRTLWMRWAPA